MIEGLIEILDRQAWQYFIFLAFIFAILVSNVIFMKKLRPPEAAVAGKVSILVPARNEEANIERCVSSLLKQEGVDFELIVMDDSSTDGTGRILSRLRSQDPRLRVIKGTGPEDGWTGKNYACWKLANESCGDVLLFTDADTFHASGSAAAAAASLKENGAGLVSGMVRQEAGSISELLLVPLMNWALLCFMPVVLAHRTKAPFLSSACGQYMAFDRRSYFDSGGHSAVKGQIVEDMELARTIKAKGGKALLLDATEVAGCRMYRGFSDAVSGFTKNLFGIFRYSVIITAFVWIWMLSVVMHPFIYILSGSISGRPAINLPILRSLVVSFAIWAVAYAKSKVPVYLALLYPVSILLWTAIAFRSMFATLLGKSSWKSRRLARPRIRLL